MKKYYILPLLLLVTFLTGCYHDTNTSEVSKSTSHEKTGTTDSVDWLDTNFTDVITGDSYKLSDFKGKTILLESFAVWCPTCRKQQEQMKKLHEEMGDSVVSVSLDTDPNESADKVLEHANSNNFDWRFSISPSEFTQILIDKFGFPVVSAPGAPVVLICPDQSSKFLDRGLKSSEKIKSEIENNC
jgi:thiol-disulfide isomerase/thioredoxin